MVQARGGAGLEAEARELGRVKAAVRLQDLERDMPAQRLLYRFVDDPHAPLADLADDAEARNRRQSRRSGRWLRFARARESGVDRV